MNDEILGKSLTVRVETIKMWSNDGSASKRQIPIYISKDKHIMVNVYDVPIDFPIYRLENIRTESDQQSFLARNKDISRDFFLDPECRDALKEQHRFLFNIANSGGDKNHYELFQKEKFKVDEELILNSKGVLLNGNTRISSIRELYYSDKNNYSHFQTIPMAILPSTLTEENEKYIEISLQIEPERKKDYKWTSEALAVNRRRRNGDSIKEIANDFKRTAAAVGHPKRLLGQLQMADKYLISINEPGDYELLIENQFALDEIYKVWVKLKDNDKMSRWWLKLAHIELSESRAGRSKGRDYENFKKWGRNFLDNPIPMLESRGVMSGKKDEKDIEEKDFIDDSDDIFGGLTIDETTDDTPVFIPDPDDVNLKDEELIGALPDGTAINIEEGLRKSNRNQLYDDVIITMDKFDDNISKVNDLSNEFDKIDETLDELDNLMNKLEDFKSVLLKRHEK